MQTIRFYTSGGQYMRWTYLNKTSYHNSVLNWIRSGNFIMIGNRRIDWINRSILHINKYYSKLITGEKHHGQNRFYK